MHNVHNLCIHYVLQQAAVPHMDSVQLPGSDSESAYAASEWSVSSDDGDEDIFVGTRADDGIDTPIWDGEEGEDSTDGPTVGELILMLVDYVAAHKLTHAAAEGAWDLLRIACPPVRRPRAYHLVRGIIRQHLKHTLVQVDLCVDGCVAFFDCASPKLSHYQYAQVCSNKTAYSGSTEVANAALCMHYS